MQKLALVLHAACMTLNAGEKRPSYPVEAVLHVFFFFNCYFIVAFGSLRYCCVTHKFSNFTTYRCVTVLCFYNYFDI